MPVDFIHPDLKERLPDYRRINKCIAGQRAIKEARTEFLPMPNPSDASEENIARYESYLMRAIFHNATGYTQQIMVGQCFAIPPVPTVPKQLDPILNNIDGNGLTAAQQSKQCLGFIVAYSRAGLFTDFPATNGQATSVADAEKNGIRPIVKLIKPWDIINWRHIQIGSETRLALVVIKEKVPTKDDGFEIEYGVQYRALRLDAKGIYYQEVYKETSTKGVYAAEAAVYPTRGDGSLWDFIPFDFIGAEGNDAEVEKPLLLDIADLNLGHYINSADYEESVYICGQPTLVMVGLDDEWITKHLDGEILIGSRKGLPLPAEADAKFIQPLAGTLTPLEAMNNKEKQMRELGAKLVEERQVRQTATEAGINESSETSILATACNNVTAAYSRALYWAAIFANVEATQESVSFELNTDFAIAKLTPEQINAIMGLFTGNLLALEEARDLLKRGGIAYLTDEKFKAAIEAQQEQAFQQAQQEIEAQKDSQIEIEKAKKSAAPAAA